jgi:hypothetical protein
MTNQKILEVKRLELYIQEYLGTSGIKLALKDEICRKLKK